MSERHKYADIIHDWTETNRHKHADVIHAWADGAKIQYWDSGFWYDIDKKHMPSFSPIRQYRVKPEDKPDIIKEFLFMLDELGQCVSSLSRVPNVRLVFDGETKQLKSVEKL